MYWAQFTIPKNFLTDVWYQGPVGGETLGMLMHTG